MKRGVPPISISDLRDHATDERIERIWEQMEAELPSADSAVGSSPRWMLGVFAAVAASLAGGLLMGKLIWDRPPPVDVAPVATLAATTPDAMEGVFAAGTRGQSFPLPGGGRLVLSPGATVELVGQHSNTVELRLLHGEATINTSGTSSSRLFALVAGETSLATQGGGVFGVRRNEHHLDVSVADGRVSVRSPQGDRDLAKGQHASAIPIRSTRPVAVRAVPPSPRGSAPVIVAEEPVVPSDPVAVVAPATDWRTHSRAGEVEEALRLLREQPGGIDAAIQNASDADELWAIHDVAVRQDPAAAYRALTQAALAFPSHALSEAAAYKLGQYYRNAGRHELAQQWYARAKTAGGVLTEDALCMQFRSSENEEEAIQLAQEYVAKYPDGRCKQEAENIISGDPSEQETAEPEELVRDEKTDAEAP